MFVIKYHKKGYKTKYLGEGGKLVSTKKAALAFGEGLKARFSELEKRENIKLQGIGVSFVAETMYKSSIVKVSKIEW